MRTTLHRTAALAATTVLASLVAVPLAAPAQAVAPVEREYFTADTDGDGFYGLYYRSTPNAAATKVFESPTLDTWSLSSSRDGSRIAYVLDTYSAAGTGLREQVVVRDVGGQVVRVLEDRAYDGVTVPGAPQLSPDGTVAVWHLHNRSTGVYTLRKAAVGSGAATTLATGLSPYAFLDSTTVLAQDANGAPYTLPVTGGTPVSASGIPADAMSVTVSPDGSHLAWGLYGSTTQASMQVAPLTLTSGVASAGTPITLDTGLFNEQPSFSRDSARVYYVKYDDATLMGDIWSAPADGTSTATTTGATATSDEGDLTITSTDDGTAPGDATAGAATPTGTSATVRWTLPTDADLSGVLVSRKLGTTVQRTTYVPAPQTALTDTGLVVGTTYTYTFTAVDRSGNAAANPAQVSLTAIAAGATFATPISTTSTKASFPVTFSTAATPSNVTFTVDYLVAGTTTWKHWVTGATGRVRTFGAPATPNVLATTSTPGTTYVFTVTATDAFGNSTAAHTSGSAIVPFDQTKATLVGSVNVASTAAYLGSYRQLKTTASYAKVTLTGNQLSIIGWKCKTCGKFNVFDGPTRIATVDSYSASTITRAVLFTKTYPAVGTHTFTIRPLATAGRPAVDLDGFAMRR